MLLGKLLPGADKRLSELEIRGWTCNSKKVENGYAFVCINGTVADGHDYAESPEGKH